MEMSLSLRSVRDIILPMMKRAYELMVVLRPDFDGENTKKREEIVKKLLGGNIVLKELASLGKKQLAYPIKKQLEGFYLLAQVEAEALKLGEIDKRAKLDDVVLRYLLTLKEEKHGKSKLK